MQGLGESLRKHKSKLQLEKEAAARQAGDAATMPSYMRPTAAFRHATGCDLGLQESLVTHRSRLEREKAAFAARSEAAKQMTPRASRPTPTTAFGGPE